jgi:hypothetical protein
VGVQDASKLQDISRPTTWLYVLRALQTSFGSTPPPIVSGFNASCTTTVGARCQRELQTRCSSLIERGLPDQTHGQMSLPW